MSHSCFGVSSGYWMWLLVFLLAGCWRRRAKVWRARVSRRVLGDANAGVIHSEPSHRQIAPKICQLSPVSSGTASFKRCPSSSSSSRHWNAVCQRLLWLLTFHYLRSFSAALITVCVSNNGKAAGNSSLSLFVFILNISGDRRYRIKWLYLELELNMLTVDRRVRLIFSPESCSDSHWICGRYTGYIPLCFMSYCYSHSFLHILRSPSALRRKYKGIKIFFLYFVLF